MPSFPRKSWMPTLPTRSDIRRLMRWNGLTLVWLIPVGLVFSLFFAKNVRTAGEVWFAVQVHAAFFGIGLLLIRWGREPE